jgi:hypothetical protein
MIQKKKKKKSSSVKSANYWHRIVETGESPPHIISPPLFFGKFKNMEQREKTERKDKKEKKRIQQTCSCHSCPPRPHD